MLDANPVKTTKPKAPKGSPEVDRRSVVNHTQARRVHDLRHACVSTWLNGGVPAPQVAEWADHSVEVLLRVYAKCIDGQDETSKRRIEQALRGY
ncbi:hypothetical protein Acsp04_57050 [Actinomadura sp. NBRC 104425]|uniref:hypothetical protein n=1 Tax=Actinomadura sp. NBRC 104425 TaxID=3032204 RepID=UPI0024A1447D|nr:hypothetical protein Acsp04_57050 [Actinomadura sp. NBRC 104425]